MANNNAYAIMINNSLTMREVLEHYDFTVNSRKFALCPFHNEKTPSMRVYDNNYYCFGCGASGDIITFICNYLDVGFTKSLEILNREFMLNLPIGERLTLRQKKEYDKLVTDAEKSRKERMERAERNFNKYLDLLKEYTDKAEDIRKYKPESPDEEPNPKFFEALQRIGYLSFALNNFDFEEEEAREL